MKSKIIFSLFAGVLLLFSGIWSFRSITADEIPLFGIEFDSAGRVKTATLPGGQKRLFEYLPDPTCSGRIRQIVQKTAGSTVHLDLDTLERPVSMTDDIGISQFDYDDFGNLSAVRNPERPLVGYVHNALDQLIEIHVNGKTTMGYEYDFLGRVTALNTPVGKVRYAYQSQPAKIRRTLPNGIQSVWEFHPDGNLAQLTHASEAGNVIARWRYDYNPENLIRHVEEWTAERGGRSWTFLYDKVRRLTDARASDGETWNYKFDATGNRLSTFHNGKEELVSYDAIGRIRSRNGKACTHDQAGNITRLSGENDNLTLEYLPDNALKQVTRAGAASVSYNYFGDGLPAARTSKGITTTFVNDFYADNIWKPLAARTNGQNEYFIWQGDTPLAVIGADGQATFYLGDHLQSTRIVCDAAGKPQEWNGFSPYGAPSSPGAGVHPGFCGMMYDADAGLYLTAHRAYAPELGRFLQIDPVHRSPDGGQKDLSLWGYCGGDPVNFRDVEGTQSNFNSGAEFFKANIYHFPGTTWDGIKGIGGFWGQAFKGGIDWENFGTPHPGTWASQAEIMGGESSKKAVQGILRTALEFETSEFALSGIGIGLGKIIPKIVPKSWLKNDIIYKSWPKGATKGDKIIHLGIGEKSHVSPHFGFPHNANGKAIFHIGLAKTFVYTGVERTTIYGSKVRGFDIPSPLVIPFSQFIENRIPRSSSRNESHSLHLGSSDQHIYGNPKGRFDPPSPPGGIALTSASQALKNLGVNLTGIAIDDNSRMILLADNHQTIDLPPLKIDDIVAVFRSVYRDGTGPYVSIDPNPDDPKGAYMLVRHDNSTAAGMAGWALFSGDRIMKCYNGGFDNLSGKKIDSGVAGYADLLDHVFTEAGTEAGWERFWIVPDSVIRTRTTDGKLTLLKVSLKVKTERMELKDGKLVTAKDPTPSAGAKQFCEWFTKNMDSIGKESRLEPPRGSGLSAPIDVFAELKRLALITAIAENLRDQRVPMPAWMEDYPVNTVESPASTPSLTVTATKGNRQIRIYGGADLSAPDASVQTRSLGKAVSANTLQIIAQQCDFQPFKIEMEGKTFTAVALPGDQTLAPAACNMTENDLYVPVSGNFYLTINRAFSSFASPRDGAFGSPWTMNLPRLLEHKIKIGNTGTEANYETRHRLVSPLLDVAEDLDKVFVTQDKRLCESCEIRLVVASDGQKLFFDDDGTLVATEQGSFLTVYRGGQNGKIRRIEGWHGSRFLAVIDLQYNAQGHLTKATGSNGEYVVYDYSGQRLTAAHLPSGDMIEYGYDGANRIASVRANGMLVQEIEYNQSNQIQRLKTGDENAWEKYQVQKANGETALSISGEQTVFDTRMRPIHQEFTDGTTIQLSYGLGEAFEQRIRLPNGCNQHLHQSPDGKTQILFQPDGEKTIASLDEQGKLLQLTRNDQLVLERIWHQNGLLKSEKSGNCLTRYEYDAEGILERILVSDATMPETNWIEIQIDPWGKPRHIRDAFGFDMQLEYNEKGENTQQYLTDYALTEVKRLSPDSLLASTSWGESVVVKVDNDSTMQVYLFREKQMAQFDVRNGKLESCQNFDGGTYHFAWNADVLKAVTDPNGINFRYGYEDRALASVEVDHMKFLYSHSKNGAGFLISLENRSD